MLASHLLQRIEANWDRIAADVIAELDRDPQLNYYKALSDQEIRHRAKDLAENLAAWMHERDNSRLAARYEQLGRDRFNEGVPLHEVIQKIGIIRRAIRSYAAQQNLGLSPVEIYAELELLRIMATFFDFVVYHVVHGYEQALRRELASEAALSPRFRGLSKPLAALAS